MVILASLFPWSLAQGAITAVQVVGTANSAKTAGTSLGVTVSNDVTDGDSIIVTFATDDGGGAVTCSDDSGGSHTWSVDLDVVNAGNVRTVICSAHNVDSVSVGTVITVSHPTPVTARAMAAVEFRGLKKASPLDQTASAIGSSTAPSSGATPPTAVADELLFGAVGVEGPPGETFTPGASWAALPREGTTGQGAASNITVNPEYRVVSATGSYQADGALGTGRNWAAGIATYQGDPSVVTVGATGTQNTNIGKNNLDEYLGGAFTFVRDAASTGIIEVVLSETNTIDANAYLSNVKMYFETAATCTYDGNETLFATALFFDGSEKATLTSFVEDTVTYNSGGSQLDRAHAMVLDASSNVYVAGRQGTNGTDWAVRKYDKLGNLDISWGVGGTITYNSGGTQVDEAQAIAIDGSSNIYVAGRQGTNGNDWAVRKYDSNGALDTSWGSSGMVTYNSGASQQDGANAIVIDASNNIYVAGYQQTNGFDWAVRKYDASGSLDTTWGNSGMVTYNSAGTQQDRANAIILDDSNNIYVAGRQGSNLADWAVRKYDATGNLDTSWGTSGMVNYNSGAGLDEASAITRDSSNNIYVAGREGTNSNDWAVRKYDASGSLDTTWGDVATPGMVTYNSLDDRAFGIAIDASNSIYVAGRHASLDWAVRKYDAGGSLDTAWGSSGMVTYSTAASLEEARAVALDPSNNLYVAGFQTTNGDDWALRKYDLTGDLCEPLPVGTSQVCGYVVLDVGSASDGDLLDVEITDPCTEVSVLEGALSPCTSVAIAGVTTEVELVYFDAHAEDGAVRLEWETGSEIDNLGFHLYRSLVEEGPYQQVTSSVIPGLGSSPQGARYTYRDPGLTNGVTYYYKLEDIETTGATELHGPTSATPSADLAVDGSGNGYEEEGTADKDPDDRTIRITYGDPSGNELLVHRGGSGRLELELVTKGFYAIPQDDGSVLLEIPGFEDFSGSDLPDVPSYRTWRDVLTGRNVVLASVTPNDVVEFGSLRPSQSESVVMAGEDGTMRMGRRRKSRSTPLPASYPESWARLLSVGFQGTAKKALVEMAPLRWDGSAGRLVLARRLVVRLSFQGRDKTEQTLARSHGEVHSHRDRDVLARLVVTEPGLYAVSFESVMGNSNRVVQTRDLRLSRRGEPVAFFVRPQSKQFDKKSTLYFLSEGAALNPYGQGAVYELETGEAGFEMAAVDGIPDGAPINYYWKTLKREENRLHQPTFEDREDLWQWDWVFGPMTKRYGFEVTNLSAVPEASQLRVWLHGASDFPEEPDHHVRVYVNGTVLGETWWDGETPQLIEAELGPGVLQEGENALEIEEAGDTEARYSMVMLDRFELTYPSLLVAEEGQVSGEFGQSGVANVVGSRAEIFDVTGQQPRRVTGAAIGPEGVSFRVESGHRYLLTDVAHTPEVRPAQPNGLKKEWNRAEYLVIGPREFLTAAEPLLAHRRDEGLVVGAIATEDIFDAFGYGEAAPESIRDFLSYVYHHWSEPTLRYVVLLGDGTYDPKDYLATGVKSRVPVKMLKTELLWTASDPWFGAINGDDILPDVSVGRLPAASPEEVALLVGKILDYESGEGSPQAPIVLVTDNPDRAGHFDADAEEIASSILFQETVAKIYLSEKGIAETRRAIVNAFDEGASIISYIGHGAIHRWATENLLDIWDVEALSPQPQQPLLLTMNCLNGYFHLPYFNSLSEELLKAEGKGVIAAFSPAGLSLNGPAHRFHKALLGQLVSGPHGRLGDAVLAAQAAYLDTGALSELLSIYHLLGDPALSLR